MLILKQSGKSIFCRCFESLCCEISLAFITYLRCAPMQNGLHQIISFWFILILFHCIARTGASAYVLNLITGLVMVRLYCWLLIGVLLCFCSNLLATEKYTKTWAQPRCSPAALTKLWRTFDPLVKVRSGSSSCGASIAFVHSQATHGTILICSSVRCHWASSLSCQLHCFLRWMIICRRFVHLYIDESLMVYAWNFWLVRQ